MDPIAIGIVILIIIGAALVWILSALGIIPAFWGTIVPIIFVAAALIIAFLDLVLKQNSPTLTPAQKRLLRGALYVVAILTLLSASVVAFFIVHPWLYPTQCAPNNGMVISLPSDLAQGVGILNTHDSGIIGLSDGSFIFDTQRARSQEVSDKQQAAEQMKDGNMTASSPLWDQAIKADSTDPEAHIYREDMLVLTSNKPYITFVVAVSLTPDAINGARFVLQGAYVQQEEFNRQHNTQVVLLIANSGAHHAQEIACQIVKAAQKDSHIKGVIGWPHSQDTSDAIGVLAAAHIPMISPSASSISLSGTSPYFFRLAPTDARQGHIAANYAKNTLHATKVAVFVDSSDSYSQSLATAFEQQFKAATNNPQSIFEVPYTRGSTDSIYNGLNDAEDRGADLIFFAGYSYDANQLLDHLPTSANLKVLGGDGLYVFDGYPPNSHSRLYFTAFAYPDMWGSQPLQPFFCEYSNDFDPSTICHGPHWNSAYGINRAQADVMLTYDTLHVFLAAAQTLVKGDDTDFTPQNLRDHIASMSPLQGITGRIEFTNNDPKHRGDTTNKVVVVLRVDQQGHTQMDDLEGCLQLAC